MRRRVDSWLNATQILKVAGFDKPQRTRILEREVQKGEHEKVQGGYGKYQGELKRRNYPQRSQLHNSYDTKAPGFLSREVWYYASSTTAKPSSGQLSISSPMQVISVHRLHLSTLLLRPP